MTFENDLVLTLTVFLLMITAYIYLDYIFRKASKNKCYYCNKKLGEYYYKGSCSYKELKNDEQIWTHNKCIPKNNKIKWRKTE